MLLQPDCAAALSNAEPSWRVRLGMKQVIVLDDHLGVAVPHLLGHSADGLARRERQGGERVALLGRLAPLMPAPLSAGYHTQFITLSRSSGPLMPLQNTNSDFKRLAACCSLRAWTGRGRSSTARTEPGVLVRW